MSASLPLEILLKYKKDFKIFFESGTNEGDSVATAIEAGFEKIISVELEEDIFLRARARFANFSQVTILHGLTTQMLEVYLPALQEKVLFFLDGHPDATNSMTPIMDEIDLIRNHPYPDLIMGDDARLMGKAKWESATVEEIYRHVLLKSPNYGMILEPNGHDPHDLMVFYPREQK